MCDADAEHLLRQNVMAEVSPELARSSSAAAQSRFSSVSVPLSFCDGAIHFIGID
jgi:hypothetical protein